MRTEITSRTVDGMKTLLVIGERVPPKGIGCGLCKHYQGHKCLRDHSECVDGDELFSLYEPRDSASTREGMEKGDNRWKRLDMET